MQNSPPPTRITNASDWDYTFVEGTQLTGVATMAMRSLEQLAGGTPLSVNEAGLVKASYALGQIKAMAKRDWEIFGAIAFEPEKR